MVDPITVEVIRSKFQALVGELRFALIRSAFSSLTRESRDCSFGILSSNGEMPLEGASSQHFVYLRAAQRLLEKVRLEDIHEGDVFIGNDPHEIGSGHAPDVLVIAPVMMSGAIEAFCTTLAHKMDFGGAVPGSIYMGATEIFQEGLLIPLMKMYDRGKVVPQIEQVIRTNVRNSDIVLGDLGAQVGSTLIGIERVRELINRYTPEIVNQTFESLLDSSSIRIRKFVAQWPGTVAESEAYLDPPVNSRHPVKLHVRVTREGDHLTFDFNETDPQVRDPINVQYSVLMKVISTCLVSMTDPNIPEHVGIARAFSVIAKEGIVLNPVSPAPVGNTTMVQTAVIDIVQNCLLTLKGASPSGKRGGHGVIVLGWREGLVPGRKYVQYEIQKSASGALEGNDGISAVNPLDYQYDSAALSSVGVLETPVEIIEAQYPVRINRYELIPDSGGPGKFRGGVSPRRVYEALTTCDLNVRHAVSFDIPSGGVEEGLPGRLGRVVINSGKSSEVEVTGWSHEVHQGDTVAFEGGGGGGYGLPFERDAESVLRDVKEGFVTPEGALSHYGVVVHYGSNQWQIDEVATRKLRL
jgi:N-methylhydantoinase B